jgi:hypothetical protein
MLTFGWALMAIGIGLLGASAIEQLGSLRLLGALYALTGIALLGIRQAAAAYSDVQRERLGRDGETATPETHLPRGAEAVGVDRRTAAGARET